MSLFNQYDREQSSTRSGFILNPFNTMPTKPSRVSLAAVGIDVAKATLSVCLRQPDGGQSALTLRNTETDIRRKLLPRLNGFSGRIVMESTNHYHWAPTLILTEQGFDVRIVNPILAKQYTSANIRRVKTDPADASGLARMAHLADNLPARFQLTSELLNLRKKLTTMATLSRELQVLHAHLRQLKETHTILNSKPSSGEDMLQEISHNLAQALSTLETEFVTESERLATDPTRAERLDTIPGVTRFCAHLALHWFNYQPAQTAKSWIGYAGLDISSKASGTWHGRCQLTKRGNSFLRRRLYSAAWGAVMSDEHFHAYYDQLRQAERPHVEALLIIARKLIRIMFQLLTTNQSYDPAKFNFGGAV